MCGEGGMHGSRRARGAVTLGRGGTVWNARVPAGAGESGKSTLFKQLRLIYGNTFTTAEREQKVRVVHGNIVEGIKTLIDRAPEMGHAIVATVREWLRE